MVKSLTLNRPRRRMSRIEEAIKKLETILDHHLCFSRREELQEVISLLQEELALRSAAAKQAKTSHEETGQIVCGSNPQNPNALD
jgi:hypothetical protein